MLKGQKGIWKTNSSPKFNVNFEVRFNPRPQKMAQRKIIMIHGDWLTNHVFSMGKGTYCPRIDLRRYSFFFAPHLGSCYISESKCNIFQVKKASAKGKWAYWYEKAWEFSLRWDAESLEEKDSKRNFGLTSLPKVQSVAIPLERPIDQHTGAAEEQMRVSDDNWRIIFCSSP